MARGCNSWQPDPEKLAGHLEALRRVRHEAQRAGAPTDVIQRYEDEIGRVERQLAEPLSERPRRLDELSRRAFIYAFGQRKPAAAGDAERHYRVTRRLPWIEGGRPGRDTKGELTWIGGEDVDYEPGDAIKLADREAPSLHSYLEGLDDEGRAILEAARAKAEAPAKLVATPGLPMFVPNIPAGLPPDEAEQAEARAWVDIFSEWAEILADRWRLHTARERTALRAVATRWGCSREKAKLRLAWVGLLEAMASAGDPWSGRVGSGKGSGKVGPLIPKEARILGQMKWLEQEALNRARRALEDADDRVYRPGGEKDLPSDPETGQPLEEARVSRTRGEDVTYEPAPKPGDAFIAAEAARKRVAEVYEAARGREGEKLDALLGYLAGCDYTEARRRAAADLGVNENAIDLTLSRLRQRL